MYTTASPINSLTWTGAQNTDWNNTNNRDFPYVPGAGVSVTVPSAPSNQPVYSNQMVAASISTVNNNGILTISTNGFNCGSITMTRAGGGNKLLLTTNAVVNITGNLGFMSNSVVLLSSGSALSIGSTLIVGCGTSGALTGSTAVSSGVMTNNGATLAAATTYIGINGSVTANPLLVINGGTNSLGTLYLYRASGGNGAPPTLGTGFVINNGMVTMGNVNWPDNSHMSIDISGGIVTNNGTFAMLQPTAQRTARFVQSRGMFVNPSANNMQLTPGASGAIDIYQLTGGTNVVNGFQFGNGAAGTVNFTVGAPVYIGSGGLSINGVTLTAALNNHALLGATADWSSSVNMAGSGTVTLQAADLNGTAHNITSAGNLNGSCTLTKTGDGTLTFSGVNGYSGSTAINAGTLALANDGSSTFGSLASPTINVATGATFDVSQVAMGYLLGSAQTIAGSGTVAGVFGAGTGANITPGGTGAQGTLTFANGLSTTNASFNIELTSDPTGTTRTNDAVSITGDLTVSGVNNIVVTPMGSLGLGTYKLITITGSLNGDATNFTCASGTIVTNTGEIDLVVTSVRPLANLTWRGDGLANLWDIGASSNWLNGVSLDHFYTGDTNTFNDSATNFTVNFVGTLSPAPLSAVLVNATNDYLFTGNGDLQGTTGLTKTNSGRLVILSTNDYSGVTTVGGGTLSVANLANGGSACAIGAAAGGSGDLVIGNGVFEYTGNNVTINRGATLTSTNSTLAVTNSVKSLTLSGTITGSGTLNKVGPGTLILSSANSYGATTVSNGNLQINNTTAAIGSGLLTLAGERLDLYSGGSQPTAANNINVTANSSLNVHGNATVFSGSWTGNQTINVTVDSGGYFTLDHDISSFAGIISMGMSTGNFRLNAGGNGSGAQQCTGSALAAFDLGTGSVVLYNRNGGGGANTYGIYKLGRLSGGSSTQLKGASNGGSTINASYYSIGARNEDSKFDGTIVDGGGGAGATTAIIKIGTGT